MAVFGRMVMIAFVIAIGAQFSLDLFMEGFIITLSVILLPLLLEAYRPINPLYTCLITAVVSPLFRMLMMALRNHSLPHSFTLTGPDAAFYLVYGIVYSLGYWRSGSRSVSRFAFTVLLADFLSNMAEVLVRGHFSMPELRIIKILFVIASIRTLLVVCAWMGFRYYRSFLAREEHENRYRRLMMLISGFKSEVYFMNMNMQQIEGIMSKSFRAYRLAQETGAVEELQNLTLDISKDVHEIKKDYIRVIKGLEDISEYRSDLSPLHIQDLVSLLVDSLRESFASPRNPIPVTTVVECDVTVTDHFYFMSVLRNLVVNGIEACKDQDAPKVELIIRENDGNVCIDCRDNGHGIKPSDQEYIFSPGFSTKYDPQSGAMNRGLGLTLVRELTEQYFKGEITVESNWGSGSRFTVVIPRTHLSGGLS